MATKKAGVKPGFSTLKARYKANTHKVQKVYKTEYETYIRAYRHEVAKAKKAGLIPKSVDARKAIPSSAISRSLGRAENVLIGKARAQKVSPKLAKQLRDEGYSVMNNRVIVEKGSRIDKRGNLVSGTGQEKSVLKRVEVGANLEDDIRKIAEQMGDGEYLTVNLPGLNQSQYFGKDMLDEFINKAYQYAFDKNGKPRLKYLYIQTLGSMEAIREWEQDRFMMRSKRKEVTQSLRKVKKAEKKKKAQEKKAKAVSPRLKRVRRKRSS